MSPVRCPLSKLEVFVVRLVKASWKGCLLSDCAVLRRVSVWSAGFPNRDPGL